MENTIFDLMETHDYEPPQSTPHLTSEAQHKQYTHRLQLT